MCDVTHVEGDGVPEENLLAAELDEHRARIADGARPGAMAKRAATGHRSVRENIRDFVGAGTFHEYGSATIAAQRSRRDLDDLKASTPADGMVTGVARVPVDGGELTCVVLGYDYTVLAGTQGYFNHKKTDRALEVARERRLPVVLFAEGGGGRPGDVDAMLVSATGLDLGTFAALGALNGLVPTVAVVTGRCFAGNAAMAGTCDIIIATADSSLGMAGPAMIEGGGLGRVAADEVGPMSVQAPNGVVDLVVDDDAQAVEAARDYLWLLSGLPGTGEAPDQHVLTTLVPQRRKLVYDIRTAIETLADDGFVLELRPEFAPNAVITIVQIGGRTCGVMANDCGVLGGAIDAVAGDKFARFMQLCEGYGIPLVSLCDTPGFMVGPDAEREGTVRHVSRMFVAGARLTVPTIVVITRKGYGLGAMAMACGGFRRTSATLAWPTAEIGAMGLEGAVRLGFAKELGAIEDPAAREERFEELVAQQYEQGKALNAARLDEIDEIIHPAETRERILQLIGGFPGERSTRPYIDTW